MKTNAQPTASTTMTTDTRNSIKARLAYFGARARVTATTLRADFLGADIVEGFNPQAAIEDILANEFGVCLRVTVANVGGTYIAPVVAPSSFDA